MGRRPPRCCWSASSRCTPTPARAAARPEQAEPLIDLVGAELLALGATVATGRFQADMAVELVNDGPVTILLET